ncbi:MAG: MBOAT family O-acyltransferase [Oscillospiraceae bacterium]
MIFSTALFLFRFLPITLALYYLAPARMKNTVLFICSLVFYSWGEVKLFPVMVVLILINYISGLGMEKYAENLKIKRAFLLFSVIGSLSMLVFFKYTDFFITNINTIFGSSIGILDLVLPLGISFYTFQTMSYSIDVYRGDVPTEHNIINFGAYVVMFPQLIAGPIVKYRDVAERLHVLKGRVTMSRIDEGISLLIFGLAKKVLLADGISALWYDIIGRYSGGKLDVAGIGLANASTPLVWLGIIAYTLQIYFDFSGYSMMGIGMGKMLGFDFPDNFNLPYISKSITEFWRRWHITLSSWFKEYVYIPLGGNRNGIKRQLVNIFIVWFLTGFWHGANWNFILWGMYYFVLLTVEKLWLLPHLKKGKIWPHIYTMLAVIIGWALFVGNDMGVSFGLLFEKLFVPSGGIGIWYYLRNYGLLLTVGVLCATPLPIKLYDKIKENTLMRGLVLALVFFVTIAYMVDATNSPFLYYRF